MMETLQLWDHVAATAPLEVSVTVLPTDYFEASLVHGPELRRQSRISAGSGTPAVVQRLFSPQAGAVLAVAAIAAATLQRVRPDLVPPWSEWLLGWWPALAWAGAWFAVNPVLLGALQAQQIRALFPQARKGAPGTPLMVRLAHGSVEASTPDRRLHMQHSPQHTVLETPAGFVMVLDDVVVPIPKRDLDPATIAALRAALRRWRLRDAPPRPSLVLPLLGAIAVALSVILMQVPPGQPAQAPRAPGQATIPIADRVMRLEGWRTPIDGQEYQVWVHEGDMYDVLRGSVRHRTATGRFTVGRYKPGNTPRTPEEELALAKADTTKELGPVGSDASVTALPDQGVLITWADPRTDGRGACGVVRTYRDQVPPAAVVPGRAIGFRRNLLLRFCAPALSPDELGDWMLAGVPAFYAEFNAVVRP